MRTRTTLFLTLLASTLAACMAGAAPEDDMPSGDDATGDDGTGDDGPSDGTGPSGFITAFAQSECMEAHACRSSFPTDAGVTFEEIFGTSEAQCESLALEYYQPDAVRDAVNAGTILFDRNAATACLADLNWGTCDQYWNGQSPLPAACGQALVGTIADGGACMIDLECSSDDSWCGDAGNCEPIPAGS
jgi:hypothetical protein